MAYHFTTDLIRLEDHHGLHQKGINEPEVGGQTGQCRGAREAVEHWVQIMHGVSQLVERLVHGHDLIAGAVKGSLFKKWPDCIARTQEPVVLRVGLLSG